jgi:hypothetical protein
MVSALRQASAQFENRQRRFGLRRLRPPQGDHAKKVMEAAPEIVRRLTIHWHSEAAETTVLLEEAEAFDAEAIQEDEKTGKAEAERSPPGRTMFTDGSRLDMEQPGMLSHGRIDYRGWATKPAWANNQDAYDAERAALARSLETAARRQSAPWIVTIVTDAQVAIRRMASEEPSPGRM